MLGIWPAPFACAAELFEFHVPSGPALEELPAIADKANHRQIMLADSLLASVTTNAVDGKMDLDGALTEALKGKGVGYKFSSKGTITFRPLTESEMKRQKVASDDRLAGSPTQSEIRDDSTALDGPKGMAETIVTTTRIAAVAPIGVPSISVTTKDLVDAGVPNFETLLRSKPQFFGGGAGPISHSVDPDAQSNSGFGTSLNSRNFGAGSTLVLLDQTRLAPSGLAGRFTDVSNIPTSAIARVDVITDGASALYGADAVGGLVNYITRDGAQLTSETMAVVGSVTHGGLHQTLIGHFVGLPWKTGNVAFAAEYFEESPLEANSRGFMTSNLSAWGGPDWDTTNSRPGTELAGGQSYAIPPSSNGRPSISQFQPNTANYEDLYKDYYLIAGQQRYSIYGAITQELGRRFQASLTGFFTYREATQDNGGQRLQVTVPNTNPFYINPSGGTDPVNVGYDFASTVGPLRTVSRVHVSSAIFAIQGSVGEKNFVRVTASAAREDERQHNDGSIDQASAETQLADPKSTLNVFGSGTGTDPSTIATIERQSTFVAESTLNAVNVTLTRTLGAFAGGDLKGAFGLEWHEQHLHTAFHDGLTGLSDEERFRRQLLSATAEFNIPLKPKDSAIGQLGLSLAGRFDAYNDFGSTVEPQLRFDWRPAPALKFTGGIGRSVKEPNLADLSERANVAAVPPHSSVMFWSGGNRLLSAEKALTVSVGLRWENSDDETAKLKAQLNYYAVRFADRISSNPLMRQASTSLLQQVCASSHFDGGYNACMNSGATGVDDLRLRNSETLYARGLDFSVNIGSSKHRWGSVNFQLDGNYVTKFAVETDTSPAVSLVNSLYNPIDLRANGRLSWELYGFGASATVHFTDRYRDTFSIRPREVGSWSTLDLQVRYQTQGATDSSEHGMELALTAQNVLNHSPPFVTNPLDQMAFDPANATVLDRVVTLWLREKW
jgi:iron complex outermembrane recepter protein